MHVAGDWELHPHYFDGCKSRSDAIDDIRTDAKSFAKLQGAEIRHMADDWAQKFAVLPFVHAWLVLIMLLRLQRGSEMGVGLLIYKLFSDVRNAKKGEE